MIVAEAGDLRYGKSTATKFLTSSSCYLHRHPNGIQSGGERNLIGRRTESDRTADGIQSDGERNPIGRRPESDRAADATRCLFVNKKKPIRE